MWRGGSRLPAKLIHTSCLGIKGKYNEHRGRGKSYGLTNRVDTEHRHTHTHTREGLRAVLGNGARREENFVQILHEYSFSAAEG